jgi:hypothetical protein
MCENKHCNRNGCEKHVPENRTDGFCSAACKKSEEIMKFVALKDSYSELPMANALLLKKTYKAERNKCYLATCENKVKEKRSKYCSVECKSKDVKYGVVDCKNCTTPFKSSYSRKTFCSMACNLEYKKVEKFCQNEGCENKVKQRGKRIKYCSSECFQNTRRKKVELFTNCQNKECNLPLSDYQSKNHQKYCSGSCYLTVRKETLGDGIGKISMRKEKNWEYPRRFIKTEKGWILLSRYTWEKANGPLPAHHFITFKDGNKFNDEEASNLDILHISKASKYNKPISHEDVEITETETSADDFFNLKDSML